MPSKRLVVASDDEVEIDNEDLVKQENEENGMVPSADLSDDFEIPKLTADVDGYHFSYVRYMEGSIVRVKLQNFVTYDFIEFCPGPNLNMVIGPNGTGKSTIVCGIALGLAGKPELLGRAKSISEFVKHGADDALIEIELKRIPENLVVTRMFQNGSKSSSWLVNGTPSTEKVVKEKIAALNAQVDNLCSFLPQDKVCEFAQMTPQTLLMQTERAVGDVDLLESHKKLIELKAQEKKDVSQYADMQKQLELQSNRLAAMEREVEYINERQKATKQIRLIQGILPFKDYEEARDERREIRDLRDKLKQTIDAQKARNEPLERELETLKEEKKEEEEEISKFLEEINENSNLMTRINSRLEAIKAETDDRIERQQNFEGEERKRQREVERLERDIGQSTRELGDMRAELVRNGLVSEDGKIIDNPVKKGELVEISRKEDELDESAGQMTEAINETTSKMADLNRQGSRIREKIEDINKRIRNLHSIEGRKLDVLKKDNMDTFRVYEWLQNNQGLFQKPVIGPICMVISPKDQRYAAAIENHISKNALLSFVCQNESDYRTLTDRTIREMKLRPNIVCFEKRLEDFQAPLSVDEIRRFGFDSYFLDVIDGPSEVLAVLCQMNNIHMAPVTLRDSVDVQGIERSQAINNYTAGQYRYVISRAYGSSTTRSTRLKPSMVLTHTVNQQESDRLTEEMAAEQQQQVELERSIRALASEDRKLRERHREIQEQKAQYRNRRMEIYKKKSEYSRAMAKIETLKMNLERQRQNEQDIVRERQENKARLRALWIEKAEQAIKMAIVNMFRKRTVHLMSVIVIQYRIKRIEDDIRAANSHLEEIEAQYADLSRKCELMKQTVSQKLEAAKAKIAEYEDDEKLEMQEQYGQTGKEELLDQLAVLQARLDVGRGGNDAAVMEDYKKRQADVEKLEASMEAAKEEVEKIKAEISKLHGSWYPKLRALIKRINEAFSAAFARIGCAGEVRLGEDEEDFSKWSIDILVKFRDKERLQQLTAHRQSGGERSVSTILYLMSLQALSRTPFRVVDEINQGMDPRNERLVHEQLVETACKPDTSQYFLITPKLLPDLRYHELMKVLCIYNGEHQPERFDTRSILANLKKKQKRK